MWVRTWSSTRWAPNWRPSGVVDSVTPSVRKTAISPGWRRIACGSENLLLENRPSGGPVLSSVHFTSPESSNVKLGMWQARAFDSFTCLGFIQTVHGGEKERG